MNADVVTTANRFLEFVRRASYDMSNVFCGRVDISAESFVEFSFKQLEPFKRSNMAKPKDLSAPKADPQ